MQIRHAWTLLAFVLITLFAVGCSTSDEEVPTDDLEADVQQVRAKGDTIVVELALDSLFTSYGLKGTIIVAQAAGDTVWIHNPKRALEGFPPASTFKIVNTLIGLETGVVNVEDTLFLWDGKKRRMQSWEADLTLAQAFHTSCVPCYQEVARKIGTERMNAYLSEFGYGRMVVTDNTIDQFWLKGPSRITPLEQIAFLRRIISGDLPVSSSSVDGLKEVMLLVEQSGFQLYGKTGWAIENRRNIGWFVGWYDVGGEIYLFATNVEPLGRKVSEDFASARHQITRHVMNKIVRLNVASSQ